MQLTIELVPIKSCNITCSHDGTCIPDEAGLKLVVICADNATIADLLRIGTERLWENYFDHARCVKLAKVRDHLGAIMTPSIKLRDLSTPSLPPPACILKVVPNRCLTTAGSTVRSTNAINTSSAIPIFTAAASSSSASFANSPTIAPAIVSKKRKSEKTAPVRAPATKRPKAGPKAAIPTPPTVPGATQQRRSSSADLRELWSTQPPPTSAQRPRPDTQQSATSQPPVQSLVLPKPTQQPAPTQSSNEENPDDMALAGFPEPIVDDIVDDDGSDIILNSQSSDSWQPNKSGTRGKPVASKIAGRKSTCKTKKFRAHKQSGKTDLIGAACKKSSQPKPTTNSQPNTMPQRSSQANSSSSQRGTAGTGTNKFDKRSNSENWTPLERQVVAEGFRAKLNARVIADSCFGPVRSHSGVRNCKDWIRRNHPLAFSKKFDTSEIGGTPAGTALQAFQMARERGERPPVRVYPEMLESDESLKTAGYENMADLVRDSTKTREGAMQVVQSSQDHLASGGLPGVEAATSQPAVDHRRSSSSVQVEDGITDGPAYASSNHALPASSDTGATSGAVEEAQAADSDKHDTEEFADIDDVIADIASSDAAIAENNSTIVGTMLTEDVPIANSPPVLVNSPTVQVSETPADEQITAEPTPTQTHANTSLTQQTGIPETLVDNGTQTSKATTRRSAKQKAAAKVAVPASPGMLIPVLPLPTSTQLTIVAPPTTTRSSRSRTARTALNSVSGALAVREPMRSRALNGGLVYPPAGIKNASVALSEAASSEGSGSQFAPGDDMSEHVVDAEVSDGDGVGDDIMQRIASGDEAEKAKNNVDEDVEELARVEPTSDSSDDDDRSPVTIGPQSKLPLAKRLSNFRAEAERIEEVERMVRAARGESPDGPVRYIGPDGKDILFGNEPIKDRIIEDVTDEDHAGAENVEMEFNADAHMEGEVPEGRDVSKGGDEEAVVMKQEPVEENVEQEEEVVEGSPGDGYVFPDFRAKDAKPHTSHLSAPVAAYGYGMDGTNEAPPPSWVPRSSQTPPASQWSVNTTQRVAEPVIKQEPANATVATPAGKTEEEKAIRRQEKQERRAKRRSTDPAQEKAEEKARRRVADASDPAAKEARREKKRIRKAKKAAKKLTAGHAGQVGPAIAA
ncbi:hypothetical protein LTR56_004200 [Elasticomyces elasticus]|nr:hypothetical protein LTR56_004200 [Elasticomyces elasticus]KAK3655089.1 hypothetical protein LTR22_010399 [Elasticomyces elasticus]KAK4910884.1 hypothetical protein LTR49_020496 [Elasticomyces elasticus]KAK5750303.1 hypothetical protein LTS12_019642 [Elasticomyces elasticus]